MTTSNRFDMSTPILPHLLSDIADDSPALLVQANKPSRLLRLPGELRNRIWDMLVIDFEPLVKHELLTYTGSSYISRFEILPPLALTCKQIRRELHPIFLSSTQFVLKSYSPDYGPDIWTKLAHGQVQRLRRIQGRLRVKETATERSYYLNVHVTSGSRLEATAVAMSPENCVCMLAQHAKEVEANLTDSEHPPAIRFFTSLFGRTLGCKEVNPSSPCEDCGKLNVALVYGG